MMTRKDFIQGTLIASTIDDLVESDHFLRKLDEMVDFTFVYDIVEDLYSETGRPSVDPVVLMKMLLIGYLYNIDSERKLEQEVRYNVAYRWFLGYDLTAKTPDHSTISVNRHKRFGGKEVFRQIFEQVVIKCFEAGLVVGENVVMDSTHIKACADNQNQEWVEVTQNIGDYWLNLMDEHPNPKKTSNDNEYVTTMKSKNPHDPDAGFMGRINKPRGFHYLSHQISDADTGIILDVAMTGADMKDHECCIQRLGYLKKDRGFAVKNIALDKGYDTLHVHHGLVKLGIEGYIVIAEKSKKPQKSEEMFDVLDYAFYSEQDVYICPNGKHLTFRNISFNRGIPMKRYAARSGECKKCQFKDRCFKGKTRYRSIYRYFGQEYREEAILRVGTFMYKSMMRKRQVVCEGNFALQKRCHNLRFTRKRRLEHVTEQALMSATALNLKRLVWYGNRGKNLEAMANMMKAGVA